VFANAIAIHSTFQEFTMYRGPILFPLALIVLGILLLAGNLGYIQFDFWLFITTWWPLLLIIGGLDILIGSLRARNIQARTLALDLGGAANTNADLTDLKVSDLRVKTGASSTTIRLPRAAGLTTVRINAGATSVKLFVPEGVAARVHSSMAIGSTDINRQRFPLSGSDYVSPDYATTLNKIDIQFEGGAGSLAVR
jgi:hypothetical protein